MDEAGRRRNMCSLRCRRHSYHRPRRKGPAPPAPRTLTALMQSRGMLVALAGHADTTLRNRGVQLKRIVAVSCPPAHATPDIVCAQQSQADPERQPRALLAQPLPLCIFYVRRLTLDISPRLLAPCRLRLPVAQQCCYRALEAATTPRVQATTAKSQKRTILHS